MGRISILPTPLEGLALVQTKTIADARGAFTRLFCQEELAPLRPGLCFPQVNLSATRGCGTLRGLHFQHRPMAEAKLIRCLRGRVFDVAVDLRKGSPTFLHWHGVELRADADTQVFVPEGFAHGFQALEEEVELLYMHTRPWSPEHDGRVRHDDPRLAIVWPLPAVNVSEADLTAAFLDAGFKGLMP
jgi:dTDP-4-dehydrorhamnose 3,5-epimerase